MTKQVDYRVSYTTTVEVEDYINEQDAVEKANAQMEMDYPVGEGHDWQMINVSDI